MSKSRKSTAPKRVVIAGAGGFVGQALRHELKETYRVAGLTRRTGDRNLSAGEWLQCDLFSLAQVERALEGADLAVYLVHSMGPGSRLTQASFRDLDLYLADNFGRAAATAGVKRIVYVGGLIPSGVELSAHLESRKEVEDALGSHGVPVTTIRAGLILGRGGSSFQILTRLVGRLPAMLCPSWTQSLTQPVELSVVVEAVQHSLKERSRKSLTFDVGGPDRVTYVDMMRRVARVLGKRRYFLTVPFFSARLSVLWVRLFSGQSSELIKPLVESLRHDMIAREGRFAPRGRSMDVVMREAMLEEKPSSRRTSTKQTVPRRDVCSVQRYALPEGMRAFDVAREYTRWLPGLMRPFLRVERDDDASCRFYAPLLRAPLLELTFSHDRSNASRTLFYITGGLLVRRRESVRPGRLEFRECHTGDLLTTVIGFEPALPWFIYSVTQAPLHLRVMNAFGRHLTRIAWQP